MNKTNQTYFNQIKIALFFFLVSALYGWSLRLYKVTDFITIDYKSILQAHSHVTFLGWGFLAVISSIGLVYYPKKLESSSYLKGLFVAMFTMLLGMLISFPIQGYKLFSILFLSVFLITSYLYLIVILKELKPNKTYSSRFIKTGIYYYFLSSLAIWVIAIVTIKFGKTILYYNSIYFYLHFLYNGFFVFTLFGLLMKYIEQKQIAIKEKYVNYFYVFTNIACVPAYALSLLWTEVPTVLYYIGFIAGFFQLISLFYLYKVNSVFLKTLVSKHLRFISIFVLTSYFLKVVMQFFSVFPVVIEKAVQLKPYFIIGYLHLFTLGFMSLFIILLVLLHSKVKWNVLGVNLLILGILLSEFLLFFQGVLVAFLTIGIPSVDSVLLVVSGLMPLGLLLIFGKLVLYNHKN